MIHFHNFTYGALNPLLAYLVSCVGCFAGLRCTTRARANSGARRARWLAMAALAIGTTGIWTMHFIAMLGFTISGQQIRYNVPVTILSMLIAVIFTATLSDTSERPESPGSPFFSTIPFTVTGAVQTWSMPDRSSTQRA